MTIALPSSLKVGPSPFYGPEHAAFRETVRRFVAKEIEPFATEWDEAGEFPRELHRKAAGIGLLQLGFPEEYDGIACHRFMRLVASQEVARERQTFGKPSEHQVICHKLVDMTQRVEATQAFLEMLTWRVEQGDNPVARSAAARRRS